jgi:hypothetical protein
MGAKASMQIIYSAKNMSKAKKDICALRINIETIAKIQSSFVSS